MSSRYWLPEGEPSAVVMIIHGMCEHIGRYDSFARYLSKNGAAVFSTDLPGHGSDCPTLGYAPGNMWEDTLDLLRKSFLTLKDKFPCLPIVVMGHSYGSFLLQRLIPELNASAYILSGSSRQQDKAKLHALLDIACAGDEQQKGDQLAALTFQAYNSSFSAEGPNAWLSRDKHQVAKYNSDPLCGFVASNNFYKGMYTGLIGLCSSDFPPATKKAVPVLIISGDKDPVGGSGQGVEALYELYRSRGYAAELALYNGARHEVLNELNYQEVYLRISDFINNIG